MPMISNRRLVIRPFLALCLLAAALLPAPAHAAPREVEVTAAGPTLREAITNGLVMALEQVRGVAIGSVSGARSELSSTVKSDERTVSLSNQQQSVTVKLTGGFVSSYRVLQVTSGTPVEVQLAVVIEVYEPVGPSNDTRRRIAILPFAMPGMSSGKRPPPIAEQLRDRITINLVQARRFAVVDRAQDSEYQQEMQLLMREAPLAERVRIGQVIGTDYIVVGKFRQVAASSSQQVIALTGEVVTNSAAGRAEADYQVIEIATRQIKFASSARVSGGAALDAVGARIAEEITQAIYPLRLIRFSDPANLIVGQGGETLKPGQRFRAMLLGEPLIDPYTKESLGQAEQEAGIVEIRRVDPKVSYAALVSGKLPPQSGDDVQIVLRPAAPLPAPARPRQTGASAPVVVKLPGDP